MSYSAKLTNLFRKVLESDSVDSDREAVTEGASAVSLSVAGATNAQLPLNLSPFVFNFPQISEVIVM